MAIKIKCPECGQTNRLLVMIETVFNLHPNGELEVNSLPSWERRDPATCPDCDHEGRIGDFEDKEA